MRHRKPSTVIALLVVLAVVWVLKNHGPAEGPVETPRPTPTGRSPAPSRQGPAVAGALHQAIAHKRSGVWVEGGGRIVHLLPEDRRPPRHQLCLVELAGGHTIKISHNVDLAPKVPWRKGERLAFRGRFEWNTKGGVVHWTHRDPKGRKAGGWLEYAGQRYK